MRHQTIRFLLLTPVAALGFAWVTYSKHKASTSEINKSVTSNKSSPSKENEQLHRKALSAKSFAKGKDYDTAFCFLIDMSLPANRKRFFVYDLAKDSIINSGLVTHGNCNQYWLAEKRYSNAVGCGCTSLGKYKIGNAYYGKFGLAFKLYGLENTNDNAYKRYVVLHSHSCVPDNEIEDNVCQSNGCPTVAPGFLKQLEPMIRNANKPVLLWIYDETK
jgi:hypothetical protein